MVKHNNVIPNLHFHKHWAGRVKTWFNQPARKLRRRVARQSKAASIFPRPVAGSLRPAVRPPTAKYNMKTRLGRGFTLEELKAAGVNVRVASTIGISVDRRRVNSSQEAMNVNVQRLKEYTSKLVVFPRVAGKVKKGDSAEDVTAAKQLTTAVLPLVKEVEAVEFREITEAEKKSSAYMKLRQNRADVRLQGARFKRAKRLAAAAAEKNM
eukprot:TRINITY_DN51_c0_g1_i4.p1 TRINITY_DN51_c0_g1~~TRINITY_DN51_c0_g1_i4.p1  ORF type:complete len:210 (+),score=124.08 TRINITY_DN51_c0_g1_i4:20-649(+)